MEMIFLATILECEHHRRILVPKMDIYYHNLIFHSEQISVEF